MQLYSLGGCTHRVQQIKKILDAFCFLDILSASCAPSSDQISISPIPVLTHPVPPSSVSICPLVGKVHQLEHQASTVPQHTFPSETSPSSFTCLSFSLFLPPFELGIHGADGKDKAAADSTVLPREAQNISWANEATRLDPLAN